MPSLRLELLPQGHNMSCDGRRIGGFGQQLQIPLEIMQGGLRMAEPIVHQAAIAYVHGHVGVDQEETLNRT